MENHSLLDLAWVALTAALVFLMQGGFALLESGLTRSKNSINVAVKNLSDLGISVLAFWAVGFGLMFGASAHGWWGTDHFLLTSTGAWSGIFFLFQAMFCSTSATIVSGAVAERMRFGSYVVATAFLSIVLYPIAGHWAWGGALDGHPTGWLAERGFVDFAGSTIVHSIGGWVSLAALLVLGPRIGRYDEKGKVQPFTGSNIPMAVIGTLLLWFGWFGFNGGSTLGVTEVVPRILVNTTLAAAAGMVGCLAVGWIWSKKPDVTHIINGSLGGLVAITAGCHAMSFEHALLIGVIGGALTLVVQVVLDHFRIDDAVGAIPVHLGAGIWGTLAVGIFGDPALLGTGLARGDQITIQIVGIVAIGLFTFLAAWGFLSLINLLWPLRVRPEHELAGLNVSEHGATTESYALFRTLEYQAKTGDLSLRAPEDPFTEVGQIAGQYNRMMSSLQANVVAKSEYLSLLDNLGEGLLLIDRQGKIGPFYSVAAERILGVENIAGLELGQLLEPLTETEISEPWKDFLEALFNQELDASLVQRVNPLRELEVHLPSLRGGLPANKHVQIHFRRIDENGSITRAMVIVRDISEETRLKRTLDLQKRDRASEMELFYHLVHVDAVQLSDFLKSFDERVGQVNRLMETGQNAPREVLKQSLRILHAIKGDAQLLELDFLADTAHGLESQVKDLQGRSDLENADFLGFTIAFGQFQDLGDRMSRMVARLAGFQTSYLEANQNPGSLGVQLETLVGRVAKDRGKQARLILAHFRETDLAAHPSLWKDILIQLVRNAVVHGIEAPLRRSALGKPTEGTVTVESRRVLGGSEILVRDDGSGLDLDGLRRRAIESGWQDYQIQKWSRSDWVKFLFTDGISTSNEVDGHAGRGVGLSLVGKLTRDHQGKLGLKFVPGQYLEFRVFLPTKATASER